MDEPGEHYDNEKDQMQRREGKKVERGEGGKEESGEGGKKEGKQREQSIYTC